jgi:hypothetical protein
MSGEVAVTGGSMNGMMSDRMDQGMAVNHHLEVQVSQAATGSVVMDVTPTIRLTDKLTGTSRDLPQVMGMYGATMGPSDFHYGQNVFLPDGTYSVTVLVGQAAQRNAPGLELSLSVFRPNSWLPVRGVRTALCLGQIRNSTDGAH